MARPAASRTQQSVRVVVAVLAAAAVFHVFDLAVPHGTTGAGPSMQLQELSTER